MKKVGIGFLFLFTLLKSCTVIDYNIELNYEFDETSFYFPIPIKTNSSFLGFQIKNDSTNTIYPELNYELLKNSSNNKIDLVVIYKEYQLDELYTFSLADDGNYYIISKNEDNQINYPREITIPKIYNDLQVNKVADYGFFNLEDLLIVNFEDEINSLGIYAFAFTSLIEFNGTYVNAESTAFTSTLLNRQAYFKKNYTFLKDNIYKKIQVNNHEYILNIDLNGGKILKEELNLYINMPIVENKVILYFENETGTRLKFLPEKQYISLSLKDYYRDVVGLEYKLITKDLTLDDFQFEYLIDTDSYQASFLNNDLRISKLKLPNNYNGKKVTVVKDIENKYLIEIDLGDNICEVRGEFKTPNLKRVKYKNEIKLNFLKNTLFFTFS